jgi:hypothetical protein
MGHSFTKDVDFGGAVVTENIALGSIGLSLDMHGYLSNLIKEGEQSEDNPFESIVEAFRFAFALGYTKGFSQKIKGKQKDVSARGFVVTEYEFLIAEECKKKEKSLAGLINEYAEAGCHIMAEHQASGGLILELLSIES